MKRRILLLEGDYTQSLPTVKALHKAGYEIDGIFTSPLSYGYGSKFFKNKYIFKETNDSEKYKDFLFPIIKSNNYDATIPLNDESALVLSKYKNFLLQYTKFDIPEWESFEKGYDKHNLMEQCKMGNFPHPKTISINGKDLEDKEISNLKFPILIKPNYSSGARGITYVENIEKLKEKFPLVVEKYGDCHIQEFIPPGGRQVEVQLYIDKNGELTQSSVISKFRWYPNNGGSSCCNESVENKAIVDKCYSLLKQIGWEGFADFDTIEDPRTGELLIMELNPRMPACVKTAYESGINWADVIVSEYLGLKHKKYDLTKRVVLRHLGFEVLWFLNSSEKFKTKPNWFHFFGKNIYYQDMNGWEDIKPFILGTWGNIKKQFSKDFRESKKGVAK